MKAELLENGNLKFTVDSEERRLLRKLKSEDSINFHSDNFTQDWFEGFIANSEYDWVRPEDCGALTDAPLIGVNSRVWGFMEYQITSPQVELLENGYAVFTSGNDEPAIDIQLMSDEILRVYIPTGQPGINSVFGDTPIKGVDAWADQGGIMLTGITSARGVHLVKHLGLSAKCMDNLCTVWQQFRQRQQQ
jgi:hypothetical protein